MTLELIPIFVAAISIAGAALTYAYQRHVDRRTALIEIRRGAYREYLRAFFAMSDSPERVEDVRRRYYQSEADLLITGSDKVVKAVGALSRYYTETNADRYNRDIREVKHLVAEVCQAMREDCFESSSLEIDEIQALVPIA